MGRQQYAAAIEISTSPSRIIIRGLAEEAACRPRTPKAAFSCMVQKVFKLKECPKGISDCLQTSGSAGAVLEGSPC